MALTYRTDARQFNADNLMILMPGARRYPTRGGDISIDSGNVSEIFVTLSELPVLSGDSNGLLLADDVRIPAGAYVEKIEVLVTKETAGTNANFNLGAVKATDMSILDADGFLAAADEFNSGTDLGSTSTYTRAGGTATTEGGALLGSVMAHTVFLCGSYDTGAFTDGILRIRVFWTMVNGNED